MNSGLFGRLFTNTDTVEPLAIKLSPITIEFAQLAIEMIDDVIPCANARWHVVSENKLTDSTKPFIVNKPQTESYNVRILFDRDPLEDRQLLKYLKETSITSGQINGWMYPSEEFEPKLKDTVTWQGKDLRVNAIDPVQPIDKTIIYFIEFSA